MRRELKELIKILSQEENKEKVLREIVKSELKKMIKDCLEEMALIEREAFCEEEGEVKNGFYERGIEGLFGRIEDFRVPRTGEGGFKPFFIKPYRKALYELEELIIAMYQGGCSTRDISRTISSLIGDKYSASWVSKITDVLQEKVEAFRRRRIERWYPFIFLDGVVLKIRRGDVEGEVVYLTLGIDEDGYKEVLGFWIIGAEGESSQVWQEILLELKERGLKEPLLFIGDGLKGPAGAIKEVYPQADFQSCILHKVRSTLSKARKRDREGIKEDLKRVYKQKDGDSFREAFAEFKSRWGRVYPEVVSSWERELPYLMTYLRYPEEVRVYIYTTNPLERFIKEVKRRSKVIEVFPDADATAKVIYLVSVEMNEKYRLKALKDFSLAKEELLSIRRAKYEVREPCLTQNY